MGRKKSVPFSRREYKPLGPKSAGIIDRIEKHSAKNYCRYPFVASRAEGAWLYDHDGNKALDFLAAYSAVLSHNHPGIREAVEKEKCDLVSQAVYNSRHADAVEMIAGSTGYDRVMMKSDGGSATDSAIGGLLMHANERGIKNPEVILTEDYFHGRAWIFGSNALFDPDQSGKKAPRVQGIKVVENIPQAVIEAVDGNTIGIFIETHKGEGGPLFSTKEDYMAMRNIAKEKGIFFGTDEIQTGLGRCGYMLAWQEYGEEARPDFVTLGKALGGGIIPVSAVAGKEEFMRIYIPGSDGSTYGAYPLACAAACASLKYIKEEGIAEKAKELGDYFVKGLKEIKGINVDHRGFLIRVEIGGIPTAKYACLEMLLGKNRDPRVFMKHGHSDPGRDVAYTRIAPPIGAMTKDLIDYALEKTIYPVLSRAGR